MFKRISHRLALQFTGFVFLLLIVNGIIFLAADFSNARRQTGARLANQVDSLRPFITDILHHEPAQLPRNLRDRVRVTDTDGTPLYEGSVISAIHFLPGRGISEARVEDEDFDVVTVEISDDSGPAGYVQLAEPKRERIGDLPQRAEIYLLISVLISALTYFVGLSFARRSLAPAEAMFLRLEQFTQDASHELKTPLAVMGSSLDVALKTKKYQEGILSAKEDLGQVSKLVDRLLELARLDTFTLEQEKISFSDLVEDSTASFLPVAAKKSVQLITKIQPGIFVHADTALIRQVLTNLQSNALKFTAAGGTVTVTLGKNSLSVADTGTGISAQDLPHIFNRFYRADASRSTEGLGLGLALSKRILDLHGWTIAVESTEGKGAVFTITFPKA
jgi:signal transduction histidine kinase